MTREQAKQVLLLYRGHPSDAADPETREALDLAAQDPELKHLLEDQLAFHSAVRGKMRQLKVPEAGKAALLAQHKIVPLPTVWWRQRVVWAAAALFVLMGTLAVLVLKQGTGPAADQFAQFQTRMIGTALRQYRMDILTDDMQRVRQFLAARGAPADYQLRPGLARLQLTGGGALKWRNNPVAMVCFDRGDNQMLYLFIAKRDVIKDPPPEAPQTRQVSQLATASWSEGDKTYVLAGPAEPDFPKKYIQP